MNGVKVVSYTYHSPDFWAAVQDSKWSTQSQNTFTLDVEGDKSKGPILEGYLGLQGDHGGQWYIRNLRVLTEGPCLKLGAVDEVCGTVVGIKAPPRSRTTHPMASQISRVDILGRNLSDFMGHYRGQSSPIAN
jgi:hypothetical protein